jgi:predicted TPR repeat methyltransferase
MLEHAGVERARRFDVLDAGCGTGLCAPLLAPYARRLVGVDLSAGMLAHARARQIYDELVQDDLTEYLPQHAEAYDLIASADTLVYVGALESVAAGASAALRANGVFVFTLEHAVGGEPGVEYRLEVHGRYSHGRDYVTRVLTSAGLQTDIACAELRMEGGVPVAGLVVCARKPA